MNEQLNTYWERTLLSLKDSFTPVIIDNFINPLKAHNYETNERRLILVSKDENSRDTVKARYLKLLTLRAREAFDDNDLVVDVYSESEILNDGTVVKNENLNRNSNLVSKYTFDTFVSGKSNEYAFSASIYVAESVGQTNSEKPANVEERSHYNPLFLHGGVGLGKTHLMHAVGNFIVRADPSIRVLYTTAENMMNEFVSSIRQGTNQEFRDKFRTIDLLLVDDIQFLVDKEGTQEEFFHTFNALYMANKQIIISSDRPPSELVRFHERLLSRFDNGTMVDISAPDFETRTAILEKKLEYRDIKLDSEVIRFIAKNISSNVRALEGALNTVANFAKLANMNITLELTERALKSKISDNDKPELSTDYIQDIVAKKSGMTKDDLKSKSRVQSIKTARHIAMYLCRKHIDCTLVQLGQDFGNRDHTSVIYACNKVESELEENPDLKHRINDIEKLIKAD